MKTNDNFLILLSKIIIITLEFCLFVIYLTCWQTTQTVCRCHPYAHYNSAVDPDNNILQFFFYRNLLFYQYAKTVSEPGNINSTGKTFFQMIEVLDLSFNSYRKGVKQHVFVTGPTRLWDLTQNFLNSGSQSWLTLMSFTNWDA